MKKIDTFLLNKFQKIADFVQDWTGLHNFAVTYVLIIIWSIFRCLSFYEQDTSFLMIYLVSIFLRLMFEFNEYGFDFWKKNPFLSNPLVSGIYLFRLSTACVFASMFFPLCNDLYNVLSGSTNFLRLFGHIYHKISDCLAVFIFYFMSCTPKPPGQSKISKKILAFKSIVSELGSRLSPRPQFG